MQTYGGMLRNGNFLVYESDKLSTTVQKLDLKTYDL
jgi:hypothetical protein